MPASAQGSCPSGWVSLSISPKSRVVTWQSKYSPASSRNFMTSWWISLPPVPFETEHARHVAHQMSLPWAPEWRLWNLPHSSGEASSSSPIRPQSVYGAGTSANTPHGRVRSSCVHVFAVSRRQRFWRRLFGFSAVVRPLVGWESLPLPGCTRGRSGKAGELGLAWRWPNKGASLIPLQLSVALF